MKLGFLRGFGKPMGLGEGISGGGTGYSISGIVYDANSSTAVGSATVTLGSLTTISAADGTYTISNVPAGTSGSLTCTKTGYLWTAISISAISGNLISQNFINTWWAAGGCGASCVAAYKSVGASSLAASYINLVIGSDDLTKVSAPTWNSTDGWICGGVTQLNTTVTPTLGTSVIVFATAFGAGTDTVLVGENGTPSWWIANRLTGGTHRGYRANGSVEIVSGPATGTYTMATVGQQGYYNGVAEGAALSPNMSLANKVLSIGSWSGSAQAQAKIKAVAFYNAVLTAAQVAAVDAAMKLFP